jgi:signal transduction histidine kinase
MATERIQAILNSVSQRVEKLVPSGRFYVVLYDSKKKELSFPLVREGKNLSTWDSRPCRSDGILPDLVVVKAKSLLYENDLISRFEDGEIHYWPDEKKVPNSWLGVPLIVGDQTLGSIVVESWQKTYSFNKNDESTLTVVARQASIAIENARLYEQLDRKVENLRILNEVGRQLASGLVKQESEILDLAIESATNLRLDTRNMYIALYDPDPDKPDTPDEIFGMIRIGLARNVEKKAPMKNRAAQKGLTEYVIRTKKSFRPLDVQQAYKEYAPDSLIKSNSPRPRSWLGVPIFFSNQVRGAIVLRNYEFEHIYTDDDREIIEILSRQIAAELNRLHMNQREKEMQEEKNAAENMAIMSLTAAEFAHKMNNLAGTIPVRIDMAKSLLDGNDPRDTKIIEYLEKIRKEADVILSAAKEIRESSEQRASEDINVHQLLEIAIARAKNTQQNAQSKVEILQIFEEGLPLICVEKNSLLDTLTSIIKNGIEAIEAQGIVTIKTRSIQRAERKFIEIEVSDMGRGIPSSDLSKIFDLFYTTKGGKGLGFGLWRDRTFIKRLGGEIDVQSEVGKGSRFTIRIPRKGEK